MRTFIRHLLALGLLTGLCFLFVWGRSAIHPLHRFNRAAADASYLLLCLTLIIGPLVKIVPSLRFLLPWRRELGIAFTVAAVLHVIVYSSRYDFAVLRFFSEVTGEGETRLLEDAFGIANIIGLVALLYAAVLFITSNDIAQGILGRGWKFLQQQSYTLFVLVLLHVALFLYMVIKAEPPTAFVRKIFVGAGLVTIGFQLTGYFLTVWQRSQLRRGRRRQL